MDVVEVPWGSEDICYWCKRSPVCEVPMNFPAVRNWSMPNCPIKSFVPKDEGIPESFKGKVIVERGSR